MSDVEVNKKLFEKLNSEILDFDPKGLDLTTTEARLDYAEINARSINIQTMILSIILVILITIAFIGHLKQ